MEGGKQAGMGGGMEGGMEGGRKAGRQEAVREGWREAGRQAGTEGGREGGTDIFDPPLIFAFLVLLVHIHLIVLHVRSLSPGMSLVALLCIFSSISTSFLRYGFHACIQYSK